MEDNEQRYFLFKLRAINSEMGFSYEVHSAWYEFNDFLLVLLTGVPGHWSRNL
ncbi:hypothetical protein MTR_0886s0010 [Medicago truncatula]|uniref:Uncharacterized protein n=1 Tax=Medicago truncatula TaxID=3880 RepID=A0A072TDP5_MEDTR|nr:hypothetical protein MTR_0886s0010 [Medicago truncatula]